MVMIPICENDHWFLINVVRPDLLNVSSNEDPFLVVLDSLGRSQDDAIRLVREYLQIEWSLKVNAVEPVYELRLCL